MRIGIRRTDGKKARVGGRKRAVGLLYLCKARKRRDPLGRGGQRLLFLMGELLDGILGTQGGRAGIALPRGKKIPRPLGTGLGRDGGRLLKMVAHPFFKILGRAGIDRAVPTQEQVDVHHSEKAAATASAGAAKLPCTSVGFPPPRPPKAA